MSCFVLAFLAQLLGADSQGSARNFCAPVVDYDSMRKEAATIFTEKRAEVQQMVGVKWLEAHATDSNVLSSSRMPGSARASKIEVVVHQVHMPMHALHAAAALLRSVRQLATFVARSPSLQH